MPAAEGEICVVLCTFPDRASGQLVALRLVEEHLVACAQLDATAIESVYWWEGKLHEETEFRLLLKLPRRLLPKVRTRIAELHPYTVPQIVDLSATANASYLAWLEDSCRPDPN